MTRSKNSNTSSTRTDWTTQDDIIAPTHTSSTIPSLQRWALATANLPSKGYHWKEAQMVQRVRRRYEADDGMGLSRSFPRYSQVNTELEVGGAGDADDDGKELGGNGDGEREGRGRKRKASMPPPAPSFGDTRSREESVDHQQERKPKRRRASLPSLQRGTDAVSDSQRKDKGSEQYTDDAESSVWSFPASDNGEGK